MRAVRSLTSDEAAVIALPTTADTTAKVVLVSPQTGVLWALHMNAVSTPPIPRAPRRLPVREDVWTLGGATHVAPGVGY